MHETERGRQVLLLSSVQKGLMGIYPSWCHCSYIYMPSYYFYVLEEIKPKPLINLYLTMVLSSMYFFFLESYSYMHELKNLVTWLSLFELTAYM